MTVFDWIIGALVLFFALKSFFRGALREIASLLGLILGIIAALRYQSVLVPLVNRHLDSPWAQSAAAAALVFIGVYIGMLIVGWFGAVLLEKLHLGFFDRCAGLAIGGIKGYILVCCVLAMLLLVPSGTEIIRSSRFSWYCLPAIRQALPYCPQPFRTMLQKELDLLREPKHQASGR